MEVKHIPVTSSGISTEPGYVSGGAGADTVQVPVIAKGKLRDY